MSRLAAYIYDYSDTKKIFTFSDGAVSSVTGDTSYPWDLRTSVAFPAGGAVAVGQALALFDGSGAISIPDQSPINGTTWEYGSTPTGIQSGGGTWDNRLAFANQIGLDGKDASIVINYPENIPDFGRDGSAFFMGDTAWIAYSGTVYKLKFDDEGTGALLTSYGYNEDLSADSVVGGLANGIILYFDGWSTIRTCADYFGPVLSSFALSNPTLLRVSPLTNIVVVKDDNGFYIFKVSADGSIIVAANINPSFEFEVLCLLYMSGGSDPWDGDEPEPATCFWTDLLNVTQICG